MRVARRESSAPVCGLVVLAAVALTLAAPVAASAATVPHWSIIATSAPTYFKAGDEGDFYELIAVNDGGAATDGSNITVTDALPPGVTATGINGQAGTGNHGFFFTTALSCPTTASCETGATVHPGELVRVKVIVSVAGSASGTLTSKATISGGGAQEATATVSTPVSSQTVPFGASLATTVTGEGGDVDTQAGSHGFGFTAMLAFNVASVDTAVECGESPGCPMLNAEVKDLNVALPPGFVGDPQAVPRCSQTVFQTYGDHSCPADTQVGALLLFFYGSGTAPQYAPVYNVEPPPGQPAELGFTVGGYFHIPMFFHVRSDGDYGLTAQLSAISEDDPVHIGVLTIWGVPAATSRDSQREGPENSGCEDGCASGVVAKPFLRTPTSCTAGELEIPFSSDSWQSPGQFPALAPAGIAGMTGCDVLSFGPAILVQPDTSQAGAPAGYSVNLAVPQNEDPEGLATPDVRDVAVALPPGTTISPSSANGLQACTAAQFRLHNSSAGDCPQQSDIGSVKVTTPLLEQPLTGHLFLGEPECSPCTPEDAQNGEMVPLLLEADGSGVNIKLAGHTVINQETGQLTTTFTDNPQLAFSDLEVKLKGGQDAALANPRVCGPAIASARLTPWSTLVATEASSPPAAIAGCSAPGFTPSLQAGMTASAQAGAFSGFAVTLSRPDGQQDLGSVTVHTPPGVLGTLSHVALCGEAQANAGTCPAASQIGSTSATVGRGTQPYEVGGGKVFLTGPYRGQPFGLSIVLPATAGPFTLAGNSGLGTEVVRASIAVDPTTAALTVTSDELPLVLNGIPLDIDRVVVNIDREAFMFNPTNCNPLAIHGTATSTAGTVAALSFPFQAVDCATLPFKPRLTVLTQAKASKANGASLHVKLVSGAGQANIGKVKVDLPKQLPARLTTLQKACPDTTFKVNPASCPGGSVVGAATAVTPVLKSPLTGPAYLVSHAGAAFPDLVIVLEGEGITLDLIGNTDIKHGVTISTFNSVPDAPISTFDLMLPEGPHSALAAYGNLCKSKLNMPTAITGQNGAVIKQTTRIAVAGCPKHKKARTGKTHRHGRRPKR